MAGKVDDTENQRVIDQKKCIAFREMKDASADFITKEWIGKNSKEENLLLKNGGRGPRKISSNRIPAELSPCLKEAKKSSTVPEKLENNKDLFWKFMFDACSFFCC